MPQSIGFWYESDGYNTSGKRLLGRQSAGASFLKSLVQHARAARLYCVAPNAKEYDDCVKRLQTWQLSRQVEFLPGGDPAKIANAEIVYRPDPAMANLAWVRRSAGQRQYSLCGVTHTICTKETMQLLGQLAIAPFQAWDALICTSTAVKTAVERMLGEWHDYLASRLGGGAAASIQVRLPVIPLGIEAEALAAAGRSKSVRGALRKTLGMHDDDLVMLYVGRLNFYAKAHPIPMYLAMERAARKTGKKLHLVQVGWFEAEKEETAFKAAAKQFCPSVQCVFLDGRQEEVRNQAWAACDAFVSLSDNIQETFGLTPLEAMAAGRPVICSDWNGYQDTVRQGVDGIRIPVMMPPPGSGLDLARDYISERLPYNVYIGHAAQCTAVDIDAVTSALETFIQHPELRERMAAAGQARAREEFDWSAIIKRYEELWDELAELRAGAVESAAPPAQGASNPLGDDPFRLFAHYSDYHLSPEHVIALGSCGTVETVSLLVKDWMTSFGAGSRLQQQEYIKILSHLKDKGPLLLADLLAAYTDRQAEAYRTVGWLLKFGVVRIVASSAAVDKLLTRYSA